MAGLLAVTIDLKIFHPQIARHHWTSWLPIWTTSSEMSLIIRLLFSLMGLVVPTVFTFDAIATATLLPQNIPTKLQFNTMKQDDNDLDSQSSSPTPIRSGKRRRRQSRIDEIFCSNTTSNDMRYTPLILGSDSDSESLDSIHLDSKGTSDDRNSDRASDTESDEVVGPRVRRKRHIALSPRSNESTHAASADGDSNADLSQEVRDINSSARKGMVTQRMRDAMSRNKRKSEFQRSLESLRKKKQGLQTDSEDENEKGRALYDTSSDIDSIGSDDFVVEDERELTLEEFMEIPPEFTSIAYQGPQFNFKVVIQAEVFALLHPRYYCLDYTGRLVFEEAHIRCHPPSSSIL
jgi:hypothetical protein